MSFHELGRTRILAVGLLFQVPEDLQQRIKFFRDDCPELLINVVELLGESFDTLIVDEGADFTATWWVALELLGRQDFSWYCFFDRQQTLYQDNKDWVPPFNAVSFILDTNLRNTRPIGEQAAKWGQINRPNAFKIEEGLLPVIQYSINFTLMGGQLKQLLRNLINREHITPERIVVLSPYRNKCEIDLVGWFI